VAAALIRPLAWEPPYATGAAQRNRKKTKTKQNKTKTSKGLDISPKKIYKRPTSI